MLHSDRNEQPTMAEILDRLNSVENRLAEVEKSLKAEVPNLKNINSFPASQENPDDELKINFKINL